MQDNREIIQKKAISTWMAEKRGTLVIATGVGKTYIALTIIDSLMSTGLISTATVVVPLTFLKKQWRDEIKKFNYKFNPEIICIQSAYKRKSTTDLLIIDEVHTASSEKYSKVFENVDHKYCLGLSATIEENSIISKYCPVVFTTDIGQAKEVGAFNEYTMYNVEVPMTKVERNTYTSFDTMFARARASLMVEVGKQKRENPSLAKLSVFDIAQKYSAFKPDKTNSLITNSKQYWAAMSLRKRVCYNANSKIESAVEIVTKLPQHKWIVFTMSIDIAEKVHSLLPNSTIYHSKMEEEAKEKALSSFADGNCGCIVAVKALDAAFNVPSISHAIAISGDSAILTAVQRLGRIARVKKQASVFINLYSSNTVEKTWVTNRTKTIPNCKWVTLASLLSNLNSL